MCSIVTDETVFVCNSMVFERRFLLYGNAFRLSKFDSNEFAKKFHSAMDCGRIQVDQNVKFGQVAVSVKFLDDTSQTAPLLEKHVLAGIISDLLGDKIEIRIESGGVGDSGDNGAL